jgi:hypothetical protein
LGLKEQSNTALEKTKNICGTLYYVTTTIHDYSVQIKQDVIGRACSVWHRLWPSPTAERVIPSPINLPSILKFEINQK